MKLHVTVSLDLKPELAEKLRGMKDGFLWPMYREIDAWADGKEGGISIVEVKEINETEDKQAGSNGPSVQEGVLS